MDELLSYATIGNFEITFFFKDGHAESRRYQPSKKKGSPWTAERYELMSKKMRESWTPERRQEMSERMKKTRREKYWSSKNKEK